MAVYRAGDLVRDPTKRQEGVVVGRQESGSNITLLVLMGGAIVTYQYVKGENPGLVRLEDYVKEKFPRYARFIEQKTNPSSNYPTASIDRFTLDTQTHAATYATSKTTAATDALDSVPSATEALKGTTAASEALDNVPSATKALEERLHTPPPSGTSSSKQPLATPPPVGPNPATAATEASTSAPTATEVLSDRAAEIKERRRRLEEKLSRADRPRYAPAPELLPTPEPKPSGPYKGSVAWILDRDGMAQTITDRITYSGGWPKPHEVVNKQGKTETVFSVSRRVRYKSTGKIVTKVEDKTLDELRALVRLELERLTPEYRKSTHPDFHPLLASDQGAVDELVDEVVGRIVNRSNTPTRPRVSRSLDPVHQFVDDAVAPKTDKPLVNPIQEREVGRSRWDPSGPNNWDIHNIITHDDAVTRVFDQTERPWVRPSFSEAFEEDLRDIRAILEYAAGAEQSEYDRIGSAFSTDFDVSASLKRVRRLQRLGLSTPLPEFDSGDIYKLIYGLSKSEMGDDGLTKGFSSLQELLAIDPDFLPDEIRDILDQIRDVDFSKVAEAQLHNQRALRHRNILKYAADLMVENPNLTVEDLIKEFNVPADSEVVRLLKDLRQTALRTRVERAARRSDTPITSSQLLSMFFDRIPEERNILLEAVHRLQGQPLAEAVEAHRERLKDAAVPAHIKDLQEEIRDLADEVEARLAEASEKTIAEDVSSMYDVLGPGEIIEHKEDQLLRRSAQERYTELIEPKLGDRARRFRFRNTDPKFRLNVSYIGGDLAGVDLVDGIDELDALANLTGKTIFGKDAEDVLSAFHEAVIGTSAHGKRRSDVHVPKEVADRLKQRLADITEANARLADSHGDYLQRAVITAMTEHQFVNTESTSRGLTELGRTVEALLRRDIDQASQVKGHVKKILDRVSGIPGDIRIPVIQTMLDKIKDPSVQAIVQDVLTSDETGRIFNPSNYLPESVISVGIGSGPASTLNDLLDDIQRLVPKATSRDQIKSLAKFDRLVAGLEKSLTGSKEERAAAQRILDSLDPIIRNFRGASEEELSELFTDLGRYTDTDLLRPYVEIGKEQYADFQAKRMERFEREASRKRAAIESKLGPSGPGQISRERAIQELSSIDQSFADNYETYIANKTYLLDKDAARLAPDKIQDVESAITRYIKARETAPYREELSDPIRAARLEKFDREYEQARKKLDKTRVRDWMGREISVHIPNVTELTASTEIPSTAEIPAAVEHALYSPSSQLFQVEDAKNVLFDVNGHQLDLAQTKYAMETGLIEIGPETAIPIPDESSFVDYQLGNNRAGILLSKGTEATWFDTETTYDPRKLELDALTQKTPHFNEFGAVRSDGDIIAGMTYDKTTRRVTHISGVTEALSLQSELTGLKDLVNNLDGVIAGANIESFDIPRISERIAFFRANGMLDESEALALQSKLDNAFKFDLLSTSQAFRPGESAAQQVVRARYGLTTEGAHHAIDDSVLSSQIYEQVAEDVRAGTTRLDVGSKFHYNGRDLTVIGTANEGLYVKDGNQRFFIARENALEVLSRSTISDSRSSLSGLVSELRIEDLESLRADYVPSKAGAKRAKNLRDAVANFGYDFDSISPVLKELANREELLTEATGAQREAFIASYLEELGKIQGDTTSAGGYIIDTRRLTTSGSRQFVDLKDSENVLTAALDYIDSGGRNIHQGLTDKEIGALERFEFDLFNLEAKRDRLEALVQSEKTDARRELTWVTAQIEDMYANPPTGYSAHLRTRHKVENLASRILDKISESGFNPAEQHAAESQARREAMLLHLTGGDITDDYTFGDAFRTAEAQIAVDPRAASAAQSQAAVDALNRHSELRLAAQEATLRQKIVGQADFDPLDLAQDLPVVTGDSKTDAVIKEARRVREQREYLQAERRAIMGSTSETTAELIAQIQGTDIKLTVPPIIEAAEDGTLSARYATLEDVGAREVIKSKGSTLAEIVAAREVLAGSDPELIVGKGRVPVQMAAPTADAATASVGATSRLASAVANPNVAPTAMADQIANSTVRIADEIPTFRGAHNYAYAGMALAAGFGLMAMLGDQRHQPPPEKRKGKNATIVSKFSGPKPINLTNSGFSIKVYDRYGESVQHIKRALRNATDTPYDLDLTINNQSGVVTQQDIKDEINEQLRRAGAL